LSLSKVCKGEKSLHSLPLVAIALAEAQAMVLFFTNRNRVKKDLYAELESYFGIIHKKALYTIVPYCLMFFLWSESLTSFGDKKKDRVRRYVEKKNTTKKNTVKVPIKGL
jgi:hypothetical protein